MSEGKMYWLISAPKTREDTFNTLNRKTADEHEFSSNYKIQIPDLKVGTLDSLMSLSDELNKIDAYVENVTRKIAQQLMDVLDTKSDKLEGLTINSNPIDTYLQFFRWEDAKYSTSNSLKSLTDIIQAQIGQLDEELRGKSNEYATVSNQLSADSRKMGGNLLTKDLSDIVQQKDVTDTEYMETLFVAVAKYSVKEFLQSYERFSELVLPRSAKLIKEDNDYAIYAVIMFRKASDDFKTAAREKKFTVREFKYDPNKSGKADRRKLEMEKEKQKKALLRWCKTNFSEAFMAWIHLKAIRIFVESVLRYGLPTNFQAMLLLPQKGKQKKLRKVLGDLYGHLSSKAILSKDEEEEGGADKFFPYVFLEINLDFRRSS